MAADRNGTEGRDECHHRPETKSEMEIHSRNLSQRIQFVGFREFRQGNIPNPLAAAGSAERGDVMLEVIQPVSCDNCSACCMGLGVPPFDQDDGDFNGVDADWDALPQSLKDEVDAAWERGVSSFVGRPCIWLNVEAKRCRNYEHRPGACRRFEPGNPFCLEDRAGANA